MNLSTWTTSPAWTLAGWTMLHFLWVGAAIAALAAIGRRALRGAPPDVRYAFALATLAALAAAPIAIAWAIAEAPRPAPAIRPAPTARVVPTVAGPITAAPPALVAPSAFAPTPSRPPVRAEVGAASASGPASPPIAPTRRGVVEYLNVAARALPGVWLLGAPWTFAYLVAGLLGAERIKKRSRAAGDPDLSALAARLAASLGIAGRVAVGVCDRIAGPMLVGIARPLILLPAAALSGWSPAQVEMALLHELAHVRRRDNLVNLLQRVVESALFFHPAVWIVSGWARREREHCCDRIVVDHTGRALDYAGALFALADAPDAPLAHGAFMARNQLADRIRRILGPQENAVTVSRSVVALAASTIAVPAILFAAYSQKSPAPAADRAPAKSSPTPADAWTPQELHAWVLREFQREPDVVALIHEIIRADEDEYQARSKGAPETDPAVKAAAERQERLRARYDALWTERSEVLRRRAPAPVVVVHPKPLEIEARIQSLFRFAPVISDLVWAIMGTDRDIDQFTAEGRDRQDKAFAAALDLKSDLMARYTTLWNEHYDELRRRVLANIEDGAPDDLESKIEGEAQRDPVMGPLLSALAQADRMLHQGGKSGRIALDPAYKMATERRGELRDEYNAAWKKHYAEFRRRIMIGADEFAPWRVDEGDLFRQDPEVAALYEGMSAADIEAQHAQDDDARKAAQKRKAELAAKSNALWTERYPELHKRAVAVLMDRFTPRPPQPAEAKSGPNAAFQMAMTKMAILPGSPQPGEFAPIPETMACHVSGAAKDGRGEPVAGARVTLYAVSSSDTKPAATTTTDAQGLYDFRGVRMPVQASSYLFSNLDMRPRILFLVSGEAPGKGVAWRQGLSIWQYNPRNLAGNGGKGHLFLNSDVTLDLTFGKAASLHGKIVDEDGKPVPGAAVRVVNYAEIGADGREKGEFLGFDWSASPQEIGRARAGADGGFRIEGLTESVCYSLVATRPEAPRTEFSLFAVTVDGPAQEHGPRSYGSFLMGGHTALANPVTITLPGLRPVEVSVVGEDDGKPVAAARIKVMGAATAEGETDAEGKLRLDLPPSEQWFLHSAPPEHSRYLLTYPDHPLVIKAGDAPMPLEIRQKVGAELILQAVEAGTGQPVPDAFFWWTVEGGVEPKTRTMEDVWSVLQRAWTDEEGVLRVAVAPAPGRRYRFHFGGMREPVTNMFSPDSPRTYGYEATPAESEPVELVPGKPIRLKFELRKGPPDPNPYRPRVRVSGAARDERGRAVAGAKVTLREITAEGARPIAVAEADAVGRYEFRDASVPFQSPSTTSKPRAALIVSGEAPGKRIAWSEPRRVIEVEASRPDIPVALDVTFVESSALRFKPELFDAEGRPTGDIPLYDRR